ncbi:MAG: cytochrome c [Propionivibrio sp.]
MKKAVIVFALLGAVGTAFAQQAAKPEDLIKARKAGMTFQAWNMGQIKANLDGDYNQEQVIAAANVVAANVNSGLFTKLFAPGTEKDVAGEKTRVKPEFFEQPDEVRELALAMAREGKELAIVAVTGDAAAVKTQFGITGKACKNCHDKFRND